MSTLAHTRQVIPITDARTGDTHLVSEDAWAAGCRAGRFTAVCGSDVLAASLTTNSEHSCQRQVESR